MVRSLALCGAFLLRHGSILSSKYGGLIPSITTTKSMLLSSPSKSSAAESLSLTTTPIRIAIVYPPPDDSVDLHLVRQAATCSNNRFAPLFDALNAYHTTTTCSRDDANNEDGSSSVIYTVQAEPCVYHPTLFEDVQQQLAQMDAVLVFVNPIQNGHVRKQRLDPLLQELSSNNKRHRIFVSTHPNMIEKLGTKLILYHTRHMSWSGTGGDIHWYPTLEQLEQELPQRILSSLSSSNETTRTATRVLKHTIGQSGSGVWKVELLLPQQQQPSSASSTDNDDTAGIASISTHPSDNTQNLVLRVRHAQRGNSHEQIMSWSEFVETCCRPAYASGGSIVDQPYQSRLPEGMIRCYLVHNQVCGFGHQAINALYPARTTSTTGDPVVQTAPEPGPRLYHPPDWDKYQALKTKVESEWIPELMECMKISAVEELPILWDLDFLLGPPIVVTRTQDGSCVEEDTYVLCEINVSSVAPYPDSATPMIVKALVDQAIRASIDKSQRQSSGQQDCD